LPLSYEGPSVPPLCKPENYPPELVSFIRRSKAKNSAWVRSRKAYMESIGFPWPDRKPPENRPPPGYYDNEDCAVEVEG
jgi:hypothetical protein